MLVVWFKALFLFLAAVLFAILAASLADEPGLVLIRWGGVEVETSIALMVSLLGVLLLLWFILRPFLRVFASLVRQLGGLRKN